MRTNVLAVLVLSLAIGGCAARVKTVTNLPAGVTQAQAQNWDSAVANLDKIASAVSSARQAVIAANKGGVFPDGKPYITTLETLGKIDQLQLSASAILKASPNNFSDSVKGQVADYMNQIAQQILVLNSQGTTGIKDANTQQTVAKFIGQITAAVALVLSL